MDFWKSDYEARDKTSVLASVQEFVNSPTLSNNSVELSSDSFTSDQTEASNKTPKASLLAKKRLQAYTVNKAKQGTVKGEQADNGLGEKLPKPSFSKFKKTVYPNDVAKAVVRDIELLKRAGYGYGPTAPSLALPPNIIVPDDQLLPLELVQLHGNSNAVPLASVSEMDDDNLFKKREIKCKNIRKSDTYYRRSASPRKRDGEKSDSNRRTKTEYPRNWTEYKEMGLNTHKHSLLKSKLVIKSRDRKFDYRKNFDFHTPPVPIEKYKIEAKNGESVWIPYPYLKCTTTKPLIMYSTNYRTISPGFLSREQLFSLIPRERRLIIEKLWKFSRCETDNKPVTIRKWYLKNWKKVEKSEAKLLEKSVGLSFLQSYSDEEEEILEDTKKEPIIEKIAEVGEEKIYTNCIETKKEVDSFECEGDLFPRVEDLSPSATPKTVPVYLEVEKEPHEEKKETPRITSWDDQSLDANDTRTPPIDDKEEGEVNSDEDNLDSEENFAVSGVDEYQKTKEELEELEAVLKVSSNYVPNVDIDIIEEIATDNQKKPKSKKKSQKSQDSKVAKSKGSKKKAKKKIEKKEKDEGSSSSESPESENAVNKKSKQRSRKKDVKVKKNKRTKAKRKKSKQKKDIETESEEEFDDMIAKTNSPKKKKKKKPKEKVPRKPVSKDSKGKDRKSSAESTEEDYEDDIKFFADRFDAERKLKGKTKHKTKTNITLEDLEMDPDTEEKISKRKNKWETSDSEGLFSPETALKKSEQKHKELFPKKSVNDEDQEIIKKDEIKVDLLKMNEDYLREQKKKEEKELTVANEDDLSSLNEAHQISKRVTSPSNEKSKPSDKVENEGRITAEASGDNVPEAPIDLELEKSREEINEDVLETSSIDECSQNITLKNVKPHEMHHPDWEQIRSKRKRLLSDSVQEKPDKKYKNLSSTESLHSETIEKIILKKEKDSIVSGIERNSSWETDDEQDSRVDDISLNLEIPLNIKSFSRREIKIEKDEFNIEPPGQEFNTPLSEFRSVAAEDVKDNRSKPKNYEEFESIDLEFDVQTIMKKRRWDIKSPATISVPKLEKSDEFIDLDANSSNNCITLENEYEEFLKALTSTKKELCSSSDSKPILIDTSSDSSLTMVEDSKEKLKPLNDSTLTHVTSGINKVLPSFGEFPSKPAIDVPTIQIPLPPVKSEPVKPVPVPSPKLEAVIDLNKPLINLSLSANVTQNITLSLATSVPSISGPTTTSIDISKPSFQISTPLSNETVVSMNNISFPFDKMSRIPTEQADVSDAKLSHLPSSSESFISTNPANIPVAADDATPSSDQVTTNKLVFTSLTIPHKKLLDNSKLNLDDSDSSDEISAEELKRKKLKALIEDNKREALIEQPKAVPVISARENVATEVPVNHQSPINVQTFSREGDPRKVSLSRTSSSDARRTEPSSKPFRRDSPPSVKRRRESSPRRRPVSPRRRSPPSRRRSPRRSPKRRSPIRRRKSLERRSISPRRRHNSISPRRHRSPSPRRKRSPLPRRNRSPSPRGKRITTTSKDDRAEISSSHRKSGRKSPSVRHRDTSPLKRSLADSTISDDQLPQVDSFDAVIPKQDMKNTRFTSPDRLPLDVRISQVLGYDTREASPKPSATPFYHDETPQLHPYYQFGEQYSKIESQVTTPTMRNVNITARTPQNTYRQVGNMLQILTSENINDIPMPHHSDILPHLTMKNYQPSREEKSTPPKRFEFSSKPEELLPKRTELGSTVLQVGNVLEIVPTEMVPTEMIPIPPPHFTEIKTEQPEEPELETPIFSPPEKPSAEASMLLKVAEMRAERESRRQERERRKKEKEKRRKEKEKARQAKLKIKTENMIKRALELEEEEDAESDIFSESHAQWPPTPLIVTHSVVKDIGKSILVNKRSRLNESVTDERKSKNVQFADGIRPGEGTSPSAGEDLGSPPPPKKKLPKEKRFKKLNFGKKYSKKKVKVKIIKKPPSPLYESDSDDNLPPPSPPPGSPPPHIFPPRIKVNPVNNVPAAYLSTIIHNAQQHQQQQQLQSQHQQQTQYQPSLYRPPIGLIMAPPPPPQGHLPSVSSHVQSPHGAALPPALSPQTHYHPTLTAPTSALTGPLPTLNEPQHHTLNAPPPPPSPHLFGHNRHY